MKTFLNVLYRRILYKIPLKWLLVLIAFVGLLFFSYSKADDVSDLVIDIDSKTATVTANGYYTVIELTSSNDYGTYCLDVLSLDGQLGLGFNSSLSWSDWLGNMIYADWLNNDHYFCTFSNMRYIFLFNPNGSSVHISYKLFKLNALMNTQLPVMTSLECQSTYSLIPVSSVDSNYCTTNNLCPSCPSCPSGGSGRSNVYINDILHVGAPNIYMNISEEIDRDYAYTAGGNNMNIDVVGYNVDYEKIGSIIDKQSYKPTSEDFQQIIGILGPYTKIIVFFVFLFIVWAWIKKPFKSKKL